MAPTRQIWYNGKSKYLPIWQAGWLYYLVRYKELVYSQVHLQLGWCKGGAVLPEGAQRGSEGQSLLGGHLISSMGTSGLYFFVYLSKQTETNTSRKIRDDSSVTREGKQVRTS